MRLTYAIRRQIKNNVFHAARLDGEFLEARTDEIKAQFDKARLLLFNKIMGKAGLKAIANVPVVYLRISHNDYIPLLIDGKHYSIDLPGVAYAGIPDQKDKGAYEFSRTSAVGREFLKAVKLQAALKTEIEELTSRIGMLLGSVNSTSQLLKIWPEGKDFLPESGRPMAIIPLETINKINAAVKGR